MGNVSGTPATQERKWGDGVLVWTQKTWLEKSWSSKMEPPWKKVVTLQGDSEQTKSGFCVSFVLVVRLGRDSIG